MTDLRTYLDAVSDSMRRVRAEYHLTLGALIEQLHTAPSGAFVRYEDGKSPGREMSYRGYYDDLAFEDGGTTTVEEFLKQCSAALNQTYEGYKGGDFRMDARTPLWRSEYGCASGEAIVGTETVGCNFILKTRMTND